MIAHIRIHIIKTPLFAFRKESRTIESFSNPFLRYTGSDWKKIIYETYILTQIRFVSRKSIQEFISKRWK
ncbi:hypothetical protein EFP84_11575 [Leptospira kmetyi]|uniref:Uncharacterized protein n=1 Tax=Leptospira kmetyi TaxID=408139 RepID=A0AAD0UR15_9LEPT|nr:hypothetical protein EFP84_11575 [Leptospira kmetyi]